MPEGHGLRDLQVSEARHGRGGFAFRQREDGNLKVFQQGEDAVYAIAQKEADVGRHLIVAGTSGVQAFARVAHQRGEAFFDIEMHVFQVKRPLELPVFDFHRNRGHAAFDVGKVAYGDDALPRQHFGVRERAAYILPPHALVEIDRSGVTLDEIGNGFRKTPSPCILQILC